LLWFKVFPSHFRSICYVQITQCLRHSDWTSQWGKVNGEIVKYISEEGGVIKASQRTFELIHKEEKIIAEKCRISMNQHLKKCAKEIGKPNIVSCINSIFDDQL